MSLQDNKDSSAEIDIVVILGFAGRTCSTWAKYTKLAESFSTDSDTMYWIGDLRQRKLDFKGVRILQFGYNGYTFMNGIVGMVVPDSILHCAKAFSDSLMLKRRTKEERERPIFFVASSLGGMVVKQALLTSKGSRINTAHWHCSKCNFTYGVVSLGTGSYSLEFDPIARLPHGFHKPAPSCGHQVFYPDDGMVSPQPWIKAWICCLHHGWLAVLQIFIVAVMGNYKLLVRTHPTGKGEPESKMVGVQSAMLWPCSQVLKYLPSLGSQMNLPTHCGTQIPDVFIHPTPTVFIFTAMAYGIVCMIYYDQHLHHKYQHRFLSLGLFIGGVLSLYLRAQSTPLNVIISVIPTSMSLALILSAILHSVWQAFFPIKKDNVFRPLQAWDVGESMLNQGGREQN